MVQYTHIHFSHSVLLSLSLSLSFSLYFSLSLDVNYRTVMNIDISWQDSEIMRHVSSSSSSSTSALNKIFKDFFLIDRKIQSFFFLFNRLWSALALDRDLIRLEAFLFFVFFSRFFSLKVLVRKAPWWRRCLWHVGKGTPLCISLKNVCTKLAISILSSTTIHFGLRLDVVSQKYLWEHLHSFLLSLSPVGWLEGYLHDNEEWEGEVLSRVIVTHSTTDWKTWQTEEVRQSTKGDTIKRETEKRRESVREWNI